MISIVSNNCVGGCLAHDLNMQYCSPTVGLQILPEEFPKFCKNIKYYLEQNITEYFIENLSNKHKQYLINMFGCIPPMPFGICDDIIICFQHYPTFEVGKSAWDRRRERFNLDDIVYMFYSRDPKYNQYIQEFVDYKFKRAVVLTENYNIDIPIENYKIIPPRGGNFLDRQENGHRYYEQYFNSIEWLDRMRKVR